MDLRRRGRSVREIKSSEVSPLRQMDYVVFVTIMFCAVSTKASTSMFGVVSWEIMIFLRRIPLCYIINVPCECLVDKVILLLL